MADLYTYNIQDLSSGLSFEMSRLLSDLGTFDIFFCFVFWCLTYIFFFTGLRQVVVITRSITFESERVRNANQEVEEAYKLMDINLIRNMGADLKASRPMDPNLIRSMGIDLKAQLAASKQRKGRGRGKERPSTFITVALLVGEDLSCLLPPNTMLGVTLHDVLLVTNTGVTLSLRKVFLTLGSRRTSGGG